MTKPLDVLSSNTMANYRNLKAFAIIYVHGKDISTPTLAYAYNKGSGISLRHRTQSGGFISYQILIR